MSKTATLAGTCTILGDAMSPAATFNLFSNYTANAAIAPPTYVQLSAGNNTITVPTGFTINAVAVIPPAGSTNAKTYRGVSGDTGFSGTYHAVVLPLNGMASFVINSTGAETVQIVWVA